MLVVWEVEVEVVDTVLRIHRVDTVLRIHRDTTGHLTRRLTRRPPITPPLRTRTHSTSHREVPPHHPHRHHHRHPLQIIRPSIRIIYLHNRPPLPRGKVFLGGASFLSFFLY